MMMLVIMLVLCRVGHDRDDQFGGHHHDQTLYDYRMMMILTMS